MKRPDGPGWRKKWAHQIERDAQGYARAKRVVAWERRPEWIEEDIRKEKSGATRESGT
jgi:hypothetical protein